MGQKIFVTIHHFVYGEVCTLWAVMARRYASRNDGPQRIDILTNLTQIAIGCLLSLNFNG